MDFHTQSPYDIIQHNKHMIDTQLHPMLIPFRQELEQLLNHDGWRFITTNTNTSSIIMNKLFYELDEISIQYKNSQYHFSLPLPNSVYSYYKKFTHTNMDTNTDNALHFLKTYINILLSYSTE